MEEIYIVDRIEEDYIVVEDNKNNIININKNEFSEIINEGDILIKIDNKYILDNNKTKDRKENINKILRNLWEE